MAAEESQSGTPLNQAGQPERGSGKDPRPKKSQAVKQLQQLFHWTIWVGIAVGIALLVVAHVVLGAGNAFRELVSTLGAVVLSASVVGLLLNAVWWRSWAIKAMVEIFSNRELVEKLNLSTEELRLRFHAMVGAVYGANILSPQFKKTCDRDLFERLGYPLRKGLELTYDLKKETFIGSRGTGQVARLDRVVSYTLHNYSKRTTEPFSNGLVLTGFVDLPESVKDEWEAIRLAEGIEAIDSPEAEESLMKLDQAIKAFKFNGLSINGVPLEEGHDFQISCLYDGKKREPDIVYRVILSEEARQRFLIESDGEMSIVYAFSTLTNTFGYAFTMMSQPTEGATFHFSWEEEVFEGVLRFIMPPYWTSRQRELRKVGERQTILFVNAMLLPGHATLVSWRPDNARQALGEWVASAATAQGDPEVGGEQGPEAVEANEQHEAPGNDTSEGDLDLVDHGAEHDLDTKR